jgi:hypothetical protein
MASSQQQQFVTFLDYHGTNASDPLLYHYIEMFGDFYHYKMNYPALTYDKAFIKWKQQYKTMPTLVLPYTATQLPTFHKILAQPLNPPPPPTPPVIVSATATTTTTLMNESSSNSVETQAAEAAEQFMSNYLINDSADYLVEDMPDLFAPQTTTTSPPTHPG